jgi:hypothetical protein
LLFRHGVTVVRHTSKTEEQEMMNMELVVLMFASAGIAASLYAKYLYWTGQLGRGVEPLRQDGDDASQARLAFRRIRP